jgi:ribonuclease-3
LSDDLERVEALLGYAFRDRSLLVTALTHRSHAHERLDAGPAHYERLEFLGDALLGYVVSDWLYRHDVTASEGVLSRRRQAVVRASTLAGAGRALGLGEAIRLGRGEELTGGRDKPSLLADTLEAVIGAIYLDGGIRAVRSFVRRTLRAALEAAGGETLTADDYKTRLQERVQGRLQRTPRYRMVSATGPPHALTFVAEVLVDQRVLGRGEGATRKQAEQDAARDALGRMNEEASESSP